MAKTKVVTNPYISALLQPTPQRGTDRRVWSIPLGGVLIPFFTASNATGESAIPAESLGCPLRLMREKDGTPKFSPSGRPVVRVVKDISDQVRIMRDNFISGLMAYTDTVRKGMPDQFKAQVEASRKAGEPVAYKDASDLDAYLAALTEKVAQKSWAEKDPSDNGQGVAQAQPERELVPA